MTTDAGARIAADYLARVDRAALHAGLPESRRLELREQLEEHLDEAAAGATGDAVTATLDAIDRLGDPEAIVREALGDVPAAPVTSVPQQAPAKRGGYEIAGIVLIAVGWLLAGLGTLLGVVAILTSKVWTAGEKLAATIAAFGPFVGLSLSLMSFPANESTSVGDVVIAASTLLCIASPVVVGAALWVRAGRRDPDRDPSAPTLTPTFVVVVVALVAVSVAIPLLWLN